MSDYEKHIGKLKKVDLSEYNNSTEKFFEEQYRKLFSNLEEFEIQSAYTLAEDYKYRRNRGPWEYLFFDNCYDFDMNDKFYVVKGNIYEIIEDKEVDDDASFLKDNGDGTYDYFIEFYNGGCCLGECIEYELEKL
jgi:hypothetical protein